LAEDAKRAKVHPFKCSQYTLTLMASLLKKCVLFVGVRCLSLRSVDRKKCNPDFILTYAFS
jgi:hypothetical protein